jgi:predicted phosphodiesterase
MWQMKFYLVSDLHLDARPDKGRAIVEAFTGDPEGVLVIAGDSAENMFFTRNPEILQIICIKYARVLLIAGNHDYYRMVPEDTVHELKALENICTNLTYLENNQIKVEHVNVLGTTLWFDPNTQAALRYTNHLADFHYIKHFVPFVNSAYHISQYILENAQDVDLVITHHMPSERSVHHRFENDPLNCYFVNDCEKHMKRLKPKVWVHGHTHYPCSYKLYDTQVYCNPLGYPGENNYHPSLKSAKPYQPMFIGDL